MTLAKDVGKISKKLTKSLVNESIVWDGAAALTFYILFALFPAVLVLLASASFIPSEDIVSQLSSWWVSYMPDSAQDIVMGVIKDLSSDKNSLQVVSFGFVFAFWTATGGVAAVMRQLNQVHRVDPQRSFVKSRLVAVAISIGIGMLLLVSVLALVAGQFLLTLFVEQSIIDLEQKSLLNVFRFGGASAILFLAFNLLYYWGPDKKQHFRFTWPGALISTLVFLATSQLYSIYLKNVANYAVTYGSLSAVIGLMLWLYILSFFLLLGAEINKLYSEVKT